jgi:hypothetical protein
MKTQYLTILAIAVLLAALASAETIIPGGNVSGIWTAAGSPYIIEGDISVAGTDSLLIEPGVEIRFNQETGLTVEGYLLADGTIQPGIGDTICFTSNLPDPQPGDWDGINVNGDWPNDPFFSLAFCAFEYGEDFIIYSLYMSFLTDCRVSSFEDQVWFDSCYEVSLLRFTFNIDVVFNEGSHYIEECYFTGNLSCPNNSHVTIASSTILQNLAFSCYWGDMDVTDSNIGGDMGIGGPNCDVTVTNCTVQGSVSGVSDTIIDTCTIYGGLTVNDSAEGVAVEVYNSSIYGPVWVGWAGFELHRSIVLNSIELHSPRDVNIHNNSIYGAEGNGISVYGSSNFETMISHNIISSSSGYGIYYDAAFYCVCGYDNVWNNNLGNYFGITPGYGSISLDPQFVDPENGDLSLQRISPCIDAGSSSWPLDPDSTIADIGALYFHQDMPVKLTLTPEDTTIVIPETGGEFNYNIEVTNRTEELQSFDFWSEIELPGWGSVEIMSITGLSIEVGETLDRDRTQRVPDFAPAGTYTYLAYVGTYPWIVDDYYYFSFQKEGSDQDGSLGNSSDWLCTGESFDEWIATPAVNLPAEFVLFDAFPNPFNPATTISFTLPEAEFVKLSIFDVSGRRVGELIDGWHDTGSHAVTFDASGLSSGIYIYRLIAGKFNASAKMVLLK